MTEFQNAQLHVTALPDYESVSLEPVSGRYRTVIYFNFAVFWFISWSGFMTGLYFLPAEWIPWAYGGGVFLLVMMILSGLITVREFKYRKYAVRERDLIYRRGLVREITSIVPFNRIQHITLLEGWLSRTLKLKTLVIYTAGGSAAMLRVPGLPAEVAERIKGLILEKIENETATAVSLNTPDED